MVDSVVQDWLANFRQTALAHDLEGHMALISPQVTVFGVPGFDALGYEDRYKQCAHEFPQSLIVALDYSRIAVRTANQSQIMFKALETTATADGGQMGQAVEMLLQRDEDSWRLKQLRILPADEARHDGPV